MAASQPWHSRKLRSLTPSPSARDIDERIAARRRDELARHACDVVEMFEIGGGIARDAGPAAEILELEIKQRQLDRSWIGAGRKRGEQGECAGGEPTALENAGFHWYSRWIYRALTRAAGS